MSAVVVLTPEALEKVTSFYKLASTEATELKHIEAIDFGSDSDDEIEAEEFYEEFETLTLISNDSEPVRFEVTKKAAALSYLLAAVLEGDSAATEVPLRRVASDMLALIVEYLNHHNGKQPAEIPKPLRSYQMHKMVEDLWDAEFVNTLKKKELFTLLMASNYMDCHSLTQLVGCKLATMIKGLSAEEIRVVFGTNGDKVPVLYPLDRQQLSEQMAAKKEKMAADKMEDSTLVADESVSGKAEPSHCVAESVQTKEDTKETAVELQSGD